MAEGSFTLETLRKAQKLIDEVGPVPFFASSKELPSDYALRFKFKGREYVGAHPDLWAKVPFAKAGTSPFQIGAIEINDLDRDTPHSRRMKAEFYEAMIGRSHPVNRA